MAYREIIRIRKDKEYRRSLSDDYRPTMIIVVIVRWLLFLAWFFLKNFPLGGNSFHHPHLVPNLLGLALVALNGYMTWRILKHHPIGWRHALALSLADLIMITASLFVTSGLQNIYYVFYYPALLGFALIFPWRASFAMLAVISGLNILMAFTIFPTPILAQEQNWIQENANLATHIITMMSIVAAGTLINGRERTQRRAAVVAEEKAEAYSQVLEDELEKGRRLQQDFLPYNLPQPSGWEIKAFLRPARVVSGDFYDTFTIPKGLVVLVIADVCDKGVGAAFFMALSRSLIRLYFGQITGDGLGIPTHDQLTNWSSSIGQREAVLSTHMDALNAVEFTNNYITQNHSGANMFVTLFFGVLDPATGMLSYINAGHEPPAILGPAGVKARLVPTGPAVGLIPAIDFDIGQVQLELGDILIAYTDGVIDARNQDSQFFTETQLLSLLKQSAPSAADLLKRLEDSVRVHIGKAVQFDDITMLAVRRTHLTISDHESAVTT